MRQKTENVVSTGSILGGKAHIFCFILGGKGLVPFGARWSAGRSCQPVSTIVNHCQPVSTTVHTFCTVLTTGKTGIAGRRYGNVCICMITGVPTQHKGLSDQGSRPPYTLHGVYCLKDREGRPAAFTIPWCRAAPAPLGRWAPHKLFFKKQ